MRNAVKTVENWLREIQRNPEMEELKLIRACEWIVLRTNDEIVTFGKESFENKVKAVEHLLDTEKYINSQLRVYYYDMKDNEHDFHNFERWKIWGRKVQ